MHAAGWSDQDLVATVAVLNEQHDVLQQVDMDPLHRRPRKQRNVWRVMVLTAVATVLVSVGAYLYFLYKPVQYRTFQDPNFTMSIPESWVLSDEYKPGSSVVLAYSSDNDDDADSTAFMTVYLNLFEDQFGRQLMDGSANARITRDETREYQKSRLRYIEYEKPATDESRSTRGAYVLSTRGELTVSATITSQSDHWGRHAEAAKRALNSITPNCSIKNLDALYDEDGAIILCQVEQ